MRTGYWNLRMNPFHWGNVTRGRQPTAQSPPLSTQARVENILDGQINSSGGGVLSMTRIRILLPICYNVKHCRAIFCEKYNTKPRQVIEGRIKKYYWTLSEAQTLSIDIDNSALFISTLDMLEKGNLRPERERNEIVIWSKLRVGCCENIRYRLSLSF